MRKLIGIFTLALVALHGSLFATARPGPCHYAFTGEWVYYTPLITNQLYASILNTSEISRGGSGQFIDPSFQSGFRIQGMYGFENCCTDMRVAWTNFSERSKERAQATAPDSIAPTFEAGGLGTAVGGSAAVDSTFALDRVEGLFGVAVFNCCDLCLSLEAGLQYCRLKYDSDRLYLSNTDSFFLSVDFKNRYWGIGPQIGLDANYCICGDFAFTGTASGALLLGETSASLQELAFPVLTTPAFSMAYKTPWQFAPSIQTRLGFSYLLWRLQIEAGYEYLTYIGGIGFLEPLGTGSSTVVQATTNLSFHGPYVSASLCF